MKQILKLGAIIYKSYVDRNQDIPYARTIFTISFLLFLHICQLGLLLDIDFLPWDASEKKSLQWLKATIFFVVVFLVIVTIFPKKKIEGIEIPVQTIKSATKILVIYFLVSLIILFVLLFHRIGFNHTSR